METLKKSLLLGLVLFLITAFMGLSLSIVYAITKPIIENRQKIKEDKARRDVLTFQKAKKKQSGAFEYHECYNTKGDIVGYTFIAEKDGYSGKIKIMVGMNTNHIIQGISILEQSETPGLGARSVEKPSKKYFWQLFKKESDMPPWFSTQYKSHFLKKKITVIKGIEYKDMDMKQINQLVQKNQVTAITGATITTTAVTLGIEEAYRKMKFILERQSTPTEQKNAK